MRDAVDVIYRRLMKRTIIIVLALLLIGGGVYYFLIGGRKTPTPYRFAQVTRGDIESVVSSTGTLSAVSTVNVGTQVSGTIEHMYVDFNSHVQKGQLMATLDPQLLQAALADAIANQDRVKAQYQQALDDYNRFKPLKEKGFISDKEFVTYQSTLDAAKASLVSAQTTVDRARTNLSYAEIRSPINGTVIQRSVDVGQTVAASFSTPTLFIIAQDLSQMQIQANVDEADIGQVKMGQPVSFTVQSQPDKTFHGSVQEIRLQPQTISNVVNYTVIVNADNDQGLLLPGMTATIDFQVAKSVNVLLVPNAALRFQPTADALAEYQKQHAGDSALFKNKARKRDSTGKSGDSTGSDSVRSSRRSGTGAGRAAGGSGRSGFASGQLPNGMARIWTVDSTNNLKMLIVHTGLTDGQNTEVQSPRITEGMQVIIGTQDATKAKTTNSGSSPLTPGGGAGGRGGGGAPRLF